MKSTENNEATMENSCGNHVQDIISFHYFQKSLSSHPYGTIITVETGFNSDSDTSIVRHGVG